MTTQVTGSGVNFNGSTSGTILLTQPAVAGSNTITLPAETGTARTTVSSGTVLQVVNYTTGAVATGTTTLPYDDTIPQNTEGNEYMSLAITPKSATSKLLVEVVWIGGNNYAGAQNITAALFVDSAAGSVAASTQTCGQSYVMAVPFSYSQTSGGTSAITFKVRAGSNAAGTTTFNGYGSARFLGGVYASTITITEVVP